MGSDSSLKETTSGQCCGDEHLRHLQLLRMPLTSPITTGSHEGGSDGFDGVLAGVSERARREGPEWVAAPLPVPAKSKPRILYHVKHLINSFKVSLMLVDSITICI